MPWDFSRAVKDRWGLNGRKSRGTIQPEQKYGGRRVVLREKDRICLP